MPPTPAKQAKSFTDIKIGDSASFSVTITHEQHDAFANLFQDYSPIHRDEKFCAKTKFMKKIGYGFMLAGFLSRFYGEHLPGGSSICLKQEANFIRPFFIGDTIRIHGEVVSKFESTQCVEIKTTMFRQTTCIFRGVGLVQMIQDENGASSL